MKLVFIFLVVCALDFMKCEVAEEIYTNLKKKSNQNVPLKREKEKCFNRNAFVKVQSNDFLKQKNKINHNSETNLNFLKLVDAECQIKIDRKAINLENGKLGSLVEMRLMDLKKYVLCLYKCLKIFSFQFIDRVLESDHVSVTDYAYFVRDEMTISEKDFCKKEAEQFNLWNSINGNNYTNNILNRDWKTLFYDRLGNFLRSHSLKFQLNKTRYIKGRGRRRDHRMLTLMVMGFMIMASILIPTGFQFLTVLGGKSLLMAKMALIMSAISGLKKIATSNVGYGFYHANNDDHLHDRINHGFQEKLYNSQSQPAAQFGLNF